MSEPSDPSCDVLVVDDESSMREFLEIVLSNEGLTIATASGGEEALDLLERRRPRVFIQDLRMGGLDGTVLLESVKRRRPEMPVIVITAYSSWENAVEAMRLGAFDYIKKPFDTDHIRSVVHRALQLSAAGGEPQSGCRPMVGNTAPMQKVYELIKKVAPTDSTVLVRGESGTGKELVARSIHSSSHRRHGNFVAVNCSAFSESLLESELFGHVRGAFTGAVENRKGLFVSAHGGTLFLDEVADMSASTQVKILRALEERRVTPVGSTDEVRIDVRIIAATNRDLELDIRAGRFREDLFYRLNVIPLYLPPLRERADDIAMLAGHFIARYAASMNRPVRSLSSRARSALIGYSWPGNVRELENVIQRHVALSEGTEIDSIELPGVDRAVATIAPAVAQGQFEVPAEGILLDDILEEIERRYLTQALEQAEGNLTKAAKILGLSYRSIRYKVKKLGVRDHVSMN
ncbi:MAG: sigma-54-dependent transcriptional regulator [Planctomycetota bacterium]